MAPHKCSECIHTIFHGACTNGDLEKVIACTTLEVDINCKIGDCGYSGLHCAAIGNSVEVLEFLLTQPNIDVNIKEMNWLVLHNIPQMENNSWRNMKLIVIWKTYHSFSLLTNLAPSQARSCKVGASRNIMMASNWHRLDMGNQHTF